ncbi:GNAT family N-acetyltransferase [Caulobacter sp. KR2-114]|uniref:GNAT family N-acetyltransferase n=1 Tax=Caulobacter sp. KR2-114 TaxID=3400912 RepID=UPI003BFB4BD9
MLKAQTVHPKELSASDADRWRQIAGAHPAFANPLFSPEFAQAVGAVRDDARVSIFERDGQTLGFLAHHRRPGALARPIGAPLADYHGLVSVADAGVRAPWLLAAAGLAAYRFTGLVDPFGVFQADVAARHESHVVALPDADADRYLETVRAASAKKFKNWRRLDHKLGRDLGELRLEGPDTSRAAFDTLVAWKREQLRRSGIHDFLSPPWVSRLFDGFFEAREGAFQGLMLNLYAGDRLVAGQFGVRLGDVYHPWLASADPELNAYSPGQLFLWRAIAAMPDLGLSQFDLGPGHDHYKRPYALTQLELGEGLAAAASSAGRAARGREQAWAAAGAHGAGLAGKLRRRLDIIATVELSITGRALGFAQAITDQTRRRGLATQE